MVELIVSDEVTEDEEEDEAVASSTSPTPSS